jgi:GNAT superfamily N-acetyltransferase
LNILNRFQLERISAHKDLIDNWLQEFPTRYPSLRLEFHKVIPDKYLVRYAELFTQFLNEMPRERDRGRKYNISPEILRNLDEWRRKNDRFLYIFTLHDDRDNMIGFTNAMVAGHDPSNVYQAMTGVISEYRGKGLSKWLKAALFRKIGEDFPDNEFMTTDMRAVNYPIQKVNEQMGYKLISEGAEYNVSLDNLTQSLMK